MRTRILLGVLITLFIWMGCGVARVGEISLDNYRNGLSPKWAEKSFQGKTLYEAVQENGHWFVRATSEASASALYYEIDYDLKEYPILTWRWKVEEVRLQSRDTSKTREDCPARVVVVFPAPLIWQSKVLSYVWSNLHPEEEPAAPQCADSQVEIALQSGDRQAGSWIEEKRNVLEDYRKHFGDNPSRVGAIAIMTDMDNTGGKATASYGPIRILADAG